MPDKERISREKFIRLGAVVGLGSAAIPLVSACGGGGGSDGSGESPKAGGASGGGGPKVGKGQAIAKESEVGPGEAFPFADAETGQQSVLVHLQGGEFAAYSAVCTHQARTVAFASVVATQLAQTLDAGRAEGGLSRSVLGAVAGSAGMLLAALTVRPLRDFLSLSVPGPLGLVLVGASALAAMLIGRVRPSPGFVGP